MADARAERGVHADLLGQQRREAPDALDVGARVLIAELDRHRQPPDGLGLRDLELCERAPKLRRASLDLLAQSDAAALAEEPAEQRGSAREPRHAYGGEKGRSRRQRPQRRDERQRQPQCPPPGRTPHGAARANAMPERSRLGDLVRARDRGAVAAVSADRAGRGCLRCALRARGWASAARPAARGSSNSDTSQSAHSETTSSLSETTISLSSLRRRQRRWT